MTEEVIKKKTIKDLLDSEKWSILSDYVSGDTSNNIAKKHGCSKGTVNNLCKTTMEALQNIYNSRLLLTRNHESGLNKIMREKCNPEHINDSFLQLTSSPEEALTEQEILFCEFLVEYGNEAKALVKAGMDNGLNREKKASYIEACKIRAFYLKRKKNVASYIQEIRQRNLGVLEERGKEYIQSELVELIDQMRSSGDKRNIGSHLKAIETLARTLGAFEDSITVQTVNGDDVLDRIIAKAKRATIEVEPKRVEDGKDSQTPVA